MMPSVGVFEVWLLCCRYSVHGVHSYCVGLVSLSPWGVLSRHEPVTGGHRWFRGGAVLLRRPLCLTQTPTAILY